MSQPEPFDPQARLIKIQGGAQYLQVRDRLIWARAEHPSLSVDTELLRLDDTIAVFKAIASYVDDDRVHVRGTGHGSETPQGFPPGFIEKAETIAIGRALAAIGYGTAAAFEEDGGKIADAPLSQPSRAQPRDSAPAPARPVTQGQGVRLISSAQQGLVRALMRERGVSDEDMHIMILADYQKDHLRDLTVRDASAYIDVLQALPIAKEQGVKQEPQRGYETNQYAVPDEPGYVRSAPGDDRFTA